MEDRRQPVPVRRVVEGEPDVRLEPEQGRSGVVPAPLEDEPVHPLSGDESHQGVGELDLPLGVRRGAPDRFEDRWGKIVRPGERGIARRVGDAGFLDEPFDAQDAGIDRRAAGDTIVPDLLLRDLFERHHAGAASEPFERRPELREQRGVADVDRVPEEDPERLVADMVLGAGDRVREAPRRPLTHKMERGFLHRLFELPERVLGAGSSEVRVVVEMILDGPLAATGHDGDVVGAPGDGLFDDVLDDRSVEHGEHLLGHALGRGQEPGPQARGWNDDLHAPRPRNESRGPTWSSRTRRRFHSLGPAPGGSAVRHSWATPSPTHSKSPRWRSGSAIPRRKSTTRGRRISRDQRAGHSR